MSITPTRSRAPDHQSSRPQAMTLLYLWLVGRDANANTDEIDDSPKLFASSDPTVETSENIGSIIADAVGGIPYYVDDSGTPVKFPTIAGAQSWTGLQTFDDGIASDTIAEKTAGAGVTIDALKIKDGFVVALDNQGIKAGTGADLTITHDATNSLITSITGNLVVDNQAVTGHTYFDLGTNTAATSWAVRSDNGTVRLEVTGAGQTTITGNLKVTGKVVATGGSVLVDAEHVDLGANYLIQNTDYTTAAAVTGGRVVNYLPTATATTTVGAGVFTAGGDGVSDPTVTTAGAATFALADIVQISGSANDGENDGFFEVVSHAANLLTLRSTANGVTNQIEDWSQGQLVANAGDVGAAITKVTVSVDRVGTDGRVEHGSGSVTPIVYADFLKVGDAAVLGSLSTAGAVTILDGGSLLLRGAGTGTGDVVQQVGATAAEAFRLVVSDETFAPAAVETNLINLPTGSMLVSVQANVQSALTGGGTTATWSIGTAADPDKYGSAGFSSITGAGAADSLAKNSASTWFGDGSHAMSLSGAAEQLVLSAAATGGAADGDTALTVGTVRVRVVYWQLQALDAAA